MTVPPVYYNNDPDSFAYTTCRVRWIKIIQDCIDDVTSAIINFSSSSPVQFKAQGETIKNKLAELKQQMLDSDVVQPFSEELVASDPSYGSYNEALESQEFTWLTGPWLVLETYLYRQIVSFFETSSLWFNYDIFDQLKRSSFTSSVDGVTELALSYYELSSKVGQIDEEALSVLFREFTEISLWGNATDLSLLATATLDDIKSIQGKEARKKSEDKILVNDIEQAWAQVKGKMGGVIDIVLDNSGFELYTDLILSLFLLEFKLADTVNLHTKDLPWMVSDVNVKDFYVVLNQLKDTSVFPQGRVEIDSLINKVEFYNNKGKLNVKTSPYWTLEKDFYEITADEKKYGGAELYSHFVRSKLVIFKGDMNYRKLTGDRKWEPTTAFTTSIGPLASQGIKVLSLRTVKADVLVGLSAGVFEKASEDWKQQGAKDGKRGWLYSGKYAVISYSHGDN